MAPAQAQEPDPEQGLGEAALMLALALPWTFHPLPLHPHPVATIADSEDFNPLFLFFLFFCFPLNNSYTIRLMHFRVAFFIEKYYTVTKYDLFICLPCNHFHKVIELFILNWQVPHIKRQKQALLDIKYWHFVWSHLIFKANYNLFCFYVTLWFWFRSSFSETNILCMYVKKRYFSSIPFFV